MERRRKIRGSERGDDRIKSPPSPGPWGGLDGQEKERPRRTNLVSKVKATWPRSVEMKEKKKRENTALVYLCSISDRKTFALFF